MSVEGVFFATTLSSGIFTFLMGLLVNVPVALAPGMGLNGFFATVSYTLQQAPITLPLTSYVRLGCEALCG